MREIKFRGYSEFYKKWLYGSLVDNLFKDLKAGKKCSYIFDTSLNENYDCWEDFIQDEELEVITNSVGQYTGLKDKNGVEIYEGDIVKINENLYEVWHSGLAFGLIDKNKNFFEYMCQLCDMNGKVYEVIGNIYENPEFLKEGN